MSGGVDLLNDSSDEPLTVCERKLQNYGSSASLYANLPECAASVLDLSHGDNVVVEVYDDRVTIRTRREGSDDE
jgi:hypothetical protein